MANTITILALRRLVYSGAFVACLSIAAPALADTIDLGNSSCSGSSCTVSGTTFSINLSATGGSFGYKTITPSGADPFPHVPMTGLGITDQTGDPTPGEIDIDEAISGAFNTGLNLDAFRLLFIYNGTEFSDPHEIAFVQINGPSGPSATFTVDTENFGTWSLPGAVITNCGSTTLYGTGCFDITNPFGSVTVNSISFTALTSGPGRGIQGNDSDFSLGAVQVSPLKDQHDTDPVPEPASILLLGTGLMGMGGAVRRRFRKN